MNEMEKGMSRWLEQKVVPGTAEWIPVCEKLTTDSGERAICMKFAADYESKKIPVEEFMASIANTTHKTLEQIEEVLNRVSKQEPQPVAELTSTRIDEKKFDTGNVSMIWYTRVGQTYTVFRTYRNPYNTEHMGGLSKPAAKELFDQYVREALTEVKPEPAAYAEPAQVVSGIDAADMTPQYMKNYIGKYVPYSITLQSKTAMPAKIRYSIGENALLITDILTSMPLLVETNPFDVANALIYITKQAGGKPIITTALTDQGWKMLTGLENRGRIKISSLPINLVQLARRDAAMTDGNLHDPVEIQVIKLPEI